MTALKDHIVELIRKSGPISVAHYMELCLTHPEHGYYTARDPLGAAGDFTTAPEISQMFGELVGLFLADYWLAAGQPEPVRLIELGPGRGTLMADALRAMKIVPGIADKAEVSFIEVSAPLKAMQQQAVPGAAWPNSLDDVAPGFTFVIANEFFDCLPIRQFVRTDRGWSERMVTEADGVLEITLDDANVPATLSLRASQTGDIREFSPQAGFWIDAIGQRLQPKGGLALIVDYGYARAETGDTLQAVKDHKYIDALLKPGTSDLTAHVNFSDLKDRALRTGLAAFGPVGQGAFLQNIGIEHRAAQLLESAGGRQKKEILAAVERLVTAGGMGTLFKVLCLTRDRMPVPAGFEEGA